MPAPSRDELSYYTAPARLSNAGVHARRFDGLPRDLPSLCALVQGLLLHVHWAEANGVTLTAERQREPNLRSLSAMLDRLFALDDASLAQARPLEHRLVGNCRHFSLLLCGLLRHQGVPARALQAAAVPPSTRRVDPARGPAAAPPCRSRRPRGGPPARIPRTTLRSGGEPALQ